ncbi:MAG: phosphodiester glycosidase family protein, partial [Bulleidia sp.]
MENRKNSVTLELLIASCIGIVFLTGIATYVLMLKIRYASSTAYSRQQMKELNTESFEYMIVKHFYSREELNSLQNPDVSASENQEETVTASDDIEIQKIYGPTYEGYMMLVHNPEDLSVAINPYFAEGGAGPSLDEYVSYYNASGGLNAGGFEDVNGKGDGSLASGIVIHDGKLISGELDAYWPMICITYTNRLTVMYATGQQMLDWGVRDAVTFQPFLISEGQVVYQSGDGNYPNLSPRSAIGQTDDGT